MEKISAHLERAMFYSRMKGFGDENECSICLESVLNDPSDELVQCHAHLTNEPRHIFHKECLFGYIRVAPDTQKNRCPYCRKEAFRQDQMHMLDDDIQNIIRTASQQEPEELQLSAEDLNAMLLNTPEISRKQFVNGNWHNTTIAGDFTHDDDDSMASSDDGFMQRYTFRDCKFNCEMDNSVISNVDFRVCNFCLSYPGRISTSLRHVQFQSVVFDRVNCMHINMDNCRFEKCDLHCNFKGVQGPNMTFVQCKGYDHEREQSLSLNCRFEEANISNGTFTQCDFEECKFWHANVSNSTFTDCTFADCHFTNANLTGSTFLRCEFRECGFKRADLRRSVFSKCICKRSDLSHAKLDDCAFQDCYISSCEFDEATLQRIKFTCVEYPLNVDQNTSDWVELQALKNAKCELNKCDFGGANLREADFTGSVIKLCIFSQALLQGVIFNECEVTECEFGTSDFANVSFVRARIYDQEFTNIQLRRANFSLAIVDGVQSIAETRRSSRYSNKPVRHS